MRSISFDVPHVKCAWIHLEYQSAEGRLTVRIHIVRRSKFDHNGVSIFNRWLNLLKGDDQDRNLIRASSFSRREETIVSDVPRHCPHKLAECRHLSS